MSVRAIVHWTDAAGAWHHDAIDSTSSDSILMAIMRARKWYDAGNFGDGESRKDCTEALAAFAEQEVAAGLANRFVVLTESLAAERAARDKAEQERDDDTRDSELWRMSEGREALDRAEARCKRLAEALRALLQRVDECIRDGETSDCEVDAIARAALKEDAP